METSESLKIVICLLIGGGLFLAGTTHGKTFKGILLMIIGILFAVCPFVNGYNNSTGGNLAKELMEYKL